MTNIGWGRSGRRVAAVAVAIGLAVVLTACGTAAGPSAPAASAPGTASVTDTAVGLHPAQVSRPIMRGRPGPAARVVVVTTPPSNSYEWTVWSFQPKRSQLQISWADGFSPACGEADEIRVFESSRVIVVGIVDTNQSATEVCAAFAVARSRTITLQAPIGRRAVLEYQPPGVNEQYPAATLQGIPPLTACPAGDVRDVPAGVVDVTDHLAPFTPTRALVCRSIDAFGRAALASRLLTTPRALQALTDAVNAAPVDPLLASGAAMSCPGAPGASYDVYLSAARVAVQVRITESGCASASNGAMIASVPISLSNLMNHLFAHRGIVE